MHNRKQQLEAIERLLNILDDLREKCPWDKKQTFDSLRNLTIEEVFELADSIDTQNTDELKKELGDVLLHIFFYAKIASEQNLFDIKTVADNICEKLIFRHPHIYGDVSVKDEKEVKANWEKLKIKEGNKSVLGGVPNSLPSIIKAYRIQEKAAGAGFDWTEKADVWAKVEEEIVEFKTEETKGATKEMEEEFGDILFSLVNYARFSGIDPDKALSKTNAKFIQRFQTIEQEAQKAGKNITDLSILEMNEIWNRFRKK